MSLLHEIQSAVVERDSDLAPILLKLRILASRLGSVPLADWVKHESEGYPAEIDVPDYRVLPVSYSATFSGPFGSGVRNAPIAPALIKHFAGDQWVNYQMRQSISEIDDLLSSADKGDGGGLGLDASNLILKLQGKVYEDYACNSVHGAISRSSLAGIRHAVKSRVLELALELETSLPQAASIELGPVATANPEMSDVANRVTQQVVYGNVTTISNTGQGVTVNVEVKQNDATTVVELLKAAGISLADAQDFAKLLQEENPESPDEPFGAKAKRWIAENLKKAADGTWKVGVAVTIELLKQAALKYYGLK